jgi:CRP-like cAMP-binding protein
MGSAQTTVAGSAELSAVLATTELFGQLADGDRNELAGACRARHYSSGQRIFSRGDAGSVMYVVARGAVALSDSSPDGDEIVFDVLRPVRTFGELSLIDNRARIATATARQATTLVGVPGVAVRRLLQTNPGFALAMLRTLAELVRGLDDHLADRTLFDLRTRVVKYLLDAAPTSPRVASDRTAAHGEVRVDLPVTQTDLARLVGGSRQHVNRIIGELERDGAIRRRGTHVVAVRPELLRSMVPDRRLRE